MRMSKSSFGLLLFMFICLGCSINKPISSSDYGSQQVNISRNVDISEENQIERKVITNAYITLVIEDPLIINKQIDVIAKKHNGYIVNKNYTSITLRVKNDQLENALLKISKFGKVQQQNLSGVDVSDQYYDYQIRLENAEKTRKRYLELVNKAENVDSILKIEVELERLNEKIDLLKGQINQINQLSQDATITIQLKEKKKPGLLGYIGIGIYQSVKWLFVRN